MDAQRLASALAQRAEEAKGLPLANMLWFRAYGSGIFGTTYVSREMFTPRMRSYVERLEAMGFSARQGDPRMQKPTHDVRMAHATWLIQASMAKEIDDALLLLGGSEGIIEYGWLVDLQPHPAYPMRPGRPPDPPESWRAGVEANLPMLPADKRSLAEHFILGYFAGALWAGGTGPLEAFPEISGISLH